MILLTTLGCQSHDEFMASLIYAAPKEAAYIYLEEGLISYRTVTGRVVSSFDEVMFYQLFSESGVDVNFHFESLCRFIDSSGGDEIKVSITHDIDASISRLDCTKRVRKEGEADNKNDTVVYSFDAKGKDEAALLIQQRIRKGKAAKYWFFSVYFPTNNLLESISIKQTHQLLPRCR